MVALQSLPPAIKALVRNPILVILFGLFAAVQLPQMLIQPSQPFVAAAISLGITGLFVLAMPFFQGGMLGMADEALDGRTSIGTLVSSGKANYLNLLLAYLAIFAINFAFGIVVMFATFFGWVGLFANGGEPSLAVLGVLVVIGLLFLLAYLLVIFTIQFYAHAIVLSGTDLVAGFKRSLSLVRRNLLSVFGYSLLLLAGSLVLGGIGTAASFFLSPQSQQTMVSVPDLSLPLIAGAAVVYVLVLALLGAFYVTYSVAFYRAIEKSRSAI